MRSWAALAACLAAACAGGPRAKRPTAQAEGPSPPAHYRGQLPATAIDTTEVPAIALAASDQAYAPLPYFVIAPDTYFLFGNIAVLDEHNRGWNGNAGFVVTDEGVLVIDALGTPKLGQRLIATVKQVTDRPIRYLIITHNHPDHAYGVAAFRRLGGVAIVSHEGAREYLESEVLARSVAHRVALLPQDMAGFEPVRPDVSIGGDVFGKKTIRLGGKTFDIYNAGKHHSYGDLIVHQVEDGIVWISDLAFNQRTTFVGDGDSKHAIEVQDWLLARFADAKLMVPGHGSAQRPPFPMVRRTQAYLQRLRHAMSDAVKRGLGLREAVEQCDFPDWRDTRMYEQNHRANANFVYREVQWDLF